MFGVDSNHGSTSGSFSCHLYDTIGAVFWSIGAELVFGGNSTAGSDCGSFCCALNIAVGGSHWTAGAVLAVILVARVEVDHSIMVLVTVMMSMTGHVALN